MTHAHVPLKPFEVIDPQPSSMPPRSRLYHLEPQGLGSAAVEGLPSYLVRLAEAHSVPTRALLRRVILPAVRQMHPTAYAECHRHGSFETPHFLVNTAWTRAVLDSLAQLTLRGDLEALTLWTWRYVLPDIGLVRQQRQWCPACYADRCAQGRPVYDPLIWSLQPIDVCGLHGCELAAHCLHCGRPQPQLAGHTALDRCRYCERALAAGKVLRVDRRADWAPRSWIWEAAGTLVAGMTPRDPPPNCDFAQRNFLACAMQYGQGSMCALTRLLHVTASLSWRVKNVCRIRLAGLLRLCYALDVMPLDFLTTAITPPKHLPHRPATARLWSGPAPQCHDRAKLEAGVQKALQAEGAPSSIRQVAVSCGYSPDYLSHLFPDECHRISERYALWVKQQGQQRRDEHGERVREVVLDLHTQGIYPSATTVCKRLGLMRLCVEHLSAWRQAKADLGL